MAGDVDVNSGKFAVAASDGSLAISSNKFTVAGNTGNTVVAGTLDVTGGTTLSSLSSGAATLSSWMWRWTCGQFEVTAAADGSLAISSSTGDTLAGTLDVTGATTLSSLSSGAATLSSTLDVAGDVDVNSGKFAVTASDGSLAISSNKFTVAGDTGNTVVVAGDDVEQPELGSYGYGCELNVTTTLSSTLKVTGAATLSSTLDVTATWTTLGSLR